MSENKVENPILIEEEEVGFLFGDKNEMNDRKKSLSIEQKLSQTNALMNSMYREINQDIQERWKELEEKEKELDERDKKRMKLEDRMREIGEKAKSKIKFDVSGTKFTASKETLLRFSGSYFSAIVQNDVWKPDEDGYYFIERDPEIFAIILEYLRSGSLKISKLDEMELEELIKDFDYFSLDLPDELKREETLLSVEDRKLINGWIGDKSIGRLLYKASKHGFDIPSNRSKFEDVGSTLIVLETVDGWMFGAYNSFDWLTTKTRTAISEKDFIFTLKNPFEIPPTPYHPKPNTLSFGQGIADSGFIIGSFDIFVNVTREESGFYANFPASYQDTTGRGSRTFAGVIGSKLKEIEVYHVNKSS